MDDFKAIITSPYSWLFGIGIAAILGVWWWKMSPTTANVTLVIGIVAITASVFLHPWIRIQPGFIRSIWTIATLSVLTLALYYTLWTPQEKPNPPAAPPSTPQIMVYPAEAFNLYAEGWTSITPVLVSNNGDKTVYSVFVKIAPTDSQVFYSITK